MPLWGPPKIGGPLHGLLFGYLLIHAHINTEAYTLRAVRIQDLIGGGRGKRTG